MTIPPKYCIFEAQPFSEYQSISYTPTTQYLHKQRCWFSFWRATPCRKRCI